MITETAASNININAKTTTTTTTLTNTTTRTYRTIRPRDCRKGDTIVRKDGVAFVVVSDGREGQPKVTVKRIVDTITLRTSSTMERVLVADFVVNVTLDQEDREYFRRIDQCVAESTNRRETTEVSVTKVDRVGNGVAKVERVASAREMASSITDYDIYPVPGSYS